MPVYATRRGADIEPSHLTIITFGLSAGLSVSFTGSGRQSASQLPIWAPSVTIRCIGR